MSFVLGEWRAGKVRPVPGNPPHGRPVSRVISSRRLTSGALTLRQKTSQPCAVPFPIEL